MVSRYMVWSTASLDLINNVVFGNLELEPVINNSTMNGEITRF